MIDEKRLEEIQKELDSVVHLKSTAMPSPKEKHELIRLARLGLWAEKHGISALTQYADPANWKDRHGKGGGVDDTFIPLEDLGGFTHGKLARAAIMALPK